MNEYIARENIKRFKQQLRTSSDHQQKATLRKLLEAEQQRLEKILGDEPDTAAEVGESTYRPRIKHHE